MLFFALGAAEQIALTACNKHLLAMIALLQGLVLVGQHETEHHLDSQQQGMEIPDNGGLSSIHIGHSAPSRSWPVQIDSSSFTSISRPCHKVRDSCFLFGVLFSRFTLAPVLPSCSREAEYSITNSFSLKVIRRSCFPHRWLYS